jgi:hypothetical protein
MLFNGKTDEMLYQDHAIVTGELPFFKLKAAQSDQRTCPRCGPGSGFLAFNPRSAIETKLDGDKME